MLEKRIVTYIPIRFFNSNVKFKYKLGEDQYQYLSLILHPYEKNTTYDQVHYLVVVGLHLISPLLA
jgi:hypothetical protein